MIDFFVHSFNTLSHGLLGYAVPFLFVLTIVVFFHELGHFLVARWAGVRVLTFSLGFGPELVGFNDRHGTRWKISAIPLGGYVKFFGDESEASTPSADTLAAMTAEERAGSFHHKKVGPRAAIVAAGPIANFILGALIFAGMALYYGKPSTIARVDGVVADGAAAAAGFKIGDVVVQIDGKPIESFADMQRIVAMNAGSALAFQVKRDGAIVSLTATPALLERKDPLRQQPPASACSASSTSRRPARPRPRRSASARRSRSGSSRSGSSSPAPSSSWARCSSDKAIPTRSAASSASPRCRRPTVFLRHHAQRLRQRRAVALGLLQRHAHRLDAVEIGALGEVLVGLPAVLQVGQFRRGQRQFLGQRDRLAADLLADPLERRLDRHAGFDADQQQVERIGKRALDRHCRRAILFFMNSSGSVHAEIGGGRGTSRS